ncbi:MAG: efflux transporter periplasmic adaptor subunit [Burkholderiales bacterium RIFCSPLOWO2_02_FULL_57_36]|nr:MAG: efflux transporter periplasmic adaptor subunit [Burkholderiales bacterium RIFCSPLOWO2_02_FULL_57_36]
MRTKKIVAALVAAGVLGASGVGLYWIGMQQGMKLTPPTAGATQPAAGNAQQGAGADSETGKKVLYWHDPMVPGHKFDKPGPSPFMDMQLVPVYANDSGDEGTISISPRVQQNLGIRTAEVIRGNLALAVEAVGSVAYNERDVALVQARSNGFVERLYVRAPLDPVKKGQPLAQLYVPDWVAAQEEYLVARQMDGAAGGALADAAKQRMRLVGMTDDLIRRIESSGKVQPRLTIVAPIGGVVSELSVREGMTVMSGAPLFRINGLGKIWVHADVPENLSAQVRPGNPVEARTPSLSGTVFKGKVGAILPEVDAATRTLKARVELANPAGQLVPGMFATVSFTSASREDALMVPTEAVIQTGTRSVVIVAEGDGKFAPVGVETGMEAKGRTEIRKGLEAGQKVVVSGQFLIDSEASLKGTATRMGEASAADADKAASAAHRGEGKVESIDQEEITLSHGPIPSLQWGEMTMGFKLPASGLPGNIAVGDTVAFAIRQTRDGMFEITSIEPLSSASGQSVKGNDQAGARK